MASKKAIISTSGFPPQYFVLQANDEGIYEVVFGPDPDLADAQRKADELNGVRARTAKGHYVADEAYVGGKVPKKKTTKKKPVAKKKATTKKK